MSLNYISSSSSVCSLISCSHLNIEKFKIEEGLLDYWEIIIVCNGTLSCKIERKCETLKSGDVLFLPAKQNFKRTIIEKLDFYHIRFVPNESLNISSNMPYGKIEFRNTERIKSSIEMFKFINKGFTDGYKEIKQHIVNDIFYQYYVEQILDNFKAPSNKYDANFYKTVKYLNDHISENVRISELAQKFKISQAGLIIKFKKFSGMSPSDYLISLRMAAARKLLQESSLSITEIAKKCGYESSYYFSNAFKRHNNLSPTLYRKKFIV